MLMLTFKYIFWNREHEEYNTMHVILVNSENYRLCNTVLAFSANFVLETITIWIWCISRIGTINLFLAAFTSCQFSFARSSSTHCKKIKTWAVYIKACDPENTE